MLAPPGFHEVIEVSFRRLEDEAGTLEYGTREELK